MSAPPDFFVGPDWLGCSQPERPADRDMWIHVTGCNACTIKMRVEGDGFPCKGFIVSEAGIFQVDGLLEDRHER